MRYAHRSKECHRLSSTPSLIRLVLKTETSNNSQIRERRRPGCDKAAPVGASIIASNASHVSASRPTGGDTLGDTARVSVSPCQTPTGVEFRKAFQSLVRTRQRQHAPTSQKNQSNFLINPPPPPTSDPHQSLDGAAGSPGSGGSSVFCSDGIRNSCEAGRAPFPIEPS